MAEHAEVLVEVDQALQVVGVVDIGVVRVQADEAVAGGDRRRGLALAVVGVGDLELRLLRVATVRKARLELLEELDCLVIGAVAYGVLGLGVEPVGRPAGGFVDLFRQQAAAAGQQRDEKAGKDRAGNEPVQECRYTTNGEDLASEGRRL